MLSERKRKIIKAVINDYIDSAAPVSSKTLAENHLPECSPATIRNELSALESMGYLVQPHISSGRVPSQKAFRYYVDQLLDIEPLSGAEIDALDNYFKENIGGVEEITHKVAKILSEITNYTSVAIKKKGRGEVIEKITLLRLNAKSALVVIVTDVNVFKDNIIPIPVTLDDRSVEDAGTWINRVFAKRALSDFCDYERVETGLTEGFAIYKEFFDKILEILKKINQNEDSKVITEGGSKILQYPEYSDVDKAHTFLSNLESPQTVEGFFDGRETFSDDENEGDGEKGGVINTRGVTVKIGGENSELYDYAVVSTKINIGEKVIGNAGVIGPVRMDYRKVISVLDYINKLILTLIEGKE